VEENMTNNLIGLSLGRYHILEQLGEGGMATVYKAYDTHLERNVAIKVILPTRQHSEKFLKRFQLEARALAKLSHPNIVGVIDYGEQDGIPYLVMEYLPGGTLKRKMVKPMPWQEAIRLLGPIARGLAAAHKQGIIHRDVKPSNILLTDTGEPMLTDFGIAKMVEAEETTDLTGTGVGVGTPEYMSPEQAQGKTVDARADIYSLGVVLYELVTGRKPYQADTPMAVVWKLASEPLPRPRLFTPELPEQVEQLLLKALAKQPVDRFEDTNQFAQGLEKLLTSPVQTGLSRKAKEPSKRRQVFSRRIYFIIGGILLGIVLLTVGDWLARIGRLGQGPLARLATATSTFTPTFTITPSTTASFTPTPAHTPTITFTRTPTPLSLQIGCPIGNWTILGPGTWNCNRDVVQAHSVRGDSLFVSTDILTDLTLVAIVSTQNREASLAIRMQDAANGYIVIFLPDGIAWNNGIGGIWLAKRVNYSETILGYYHDSKYPKLGEQAQLSVSVKGSKIIVIFNGAKVIQANDSTFTSGYVGLRINGDSGLPCDATFQDITIQNNP